jgi:Secretion system C-terminal sorting domain
MRLLVFFLLYSSSLFAQAPYFETYLGGNLPDLGRSLKQLPDSCIYMTGFSTDTATQQNNTMLYKLSPAGNLIWAKNLGDSLEETARYIEISRDGNLYICGEKHTPSNHTDGRLLKVDTAGNILWEKLFGASQYESFERLAVLADGKLVMTGFQTDAGGFNGIYLVCTDGNGNLIWDANYGDTYNDIGMGICAMPDSGFVISGETQRGFGGNYDIKVMRFSKTGQILFDSVYTYGDTVSDGCQGIILLNDGNLFVYGESPANAGSWFDFLFHKIDPNGNTVWWHKQGGTNPDAAFSMVETWNGFMGTGYSSSFSQGPNNIIVFRCDSQGNLLWANPYGGPGVDIGYEIIPAIGGGYYIGGTGSVNGNDQCALLHVDDAGWASSGEWGGDPSLSLFPLPANDRVFISFAEERLYTNMKIYDVSGKCVFESSFTNTRSIEINTTNWASGIYFLRLESDKKEFTGKLLIQH